MAKRSYITFVLLLFNSLLYSQIHYELIATSTIVCSNIVFDADPKGKYYVTIRNNVVRLNENDLIIVGVLAESNRKNYEAMIYDKHYNYLYINNRGQIVNGMGKSVGRIKRHDSS